jgi:CRISPR/Cas system-associated exonuclease Cas4 (RecB family)
VALTHDPYPPEAFNPAQREVLEVIGAPRSAWPTFPAGLRQELRHELESGLAPVVERLDKRFDQRLGAQTGEATPATIYLSKHTLSGVLGCEARFVHEDAAGFPGWSVPLARGTVAHRAIELSAHTRGALEPLELVDEAMARLARTDTSLADWLQRLTDTERAELRAGVNDHVAKFVEAWPPLRAAWRPVTESSWRVELHGTRVVLSGRADLTLQRAEGLVARKVVIDLKTGGFSPSHLDDVRFYALLEALRLGTPPRLVATYYLDSGRFVSETVTEAMLWSAVARVVGAATRLVELRAPRPPPEPVYRPGPACRWCPLVEGCAAARGAGTATGGWG